jgi:hypothetical protein
MKMKLTKAIGFAAWMSFSAVAVQAQSILYVDANATGAGNGTSWTNAYPFLQDALAETESSGGAISEIWVAAGTYKPDQGVSQTTGDRQATFRLLDGVALYGGFEGGETELGQRDIAANVTILSGDLNGDDGPDFANYAENSYHVVTYDDPAATGVVIDGFTISGGNADGPDGLTNQGGGIHIRDGLVPCLPGGPTIRNCIVENNWAAHHGAINDHGLTTVIENCIVRNNFSGHEGGGLQIHSGAPTITNTRFESNVSDGEGGGAWAGSDNDPTCAGPSAPTFSHCNFSENVAAVGAGLFVNANGHPTLHGCLFSGNAASLRGGGMYNHNDGSPTLTHCRFIGNSSERGAGMFSTIGVTATLIDCVFESNAATRKGGGMYNIGTNPPGLTRPTLIRCVFVNNTAIGLVAGLGDGGAMYNEVNATPSLTDCWFIGNQATVVGGAISTYGASEEPPFDVTNCVFLGNRSTHGRAGAMHCSVGGVYRFTNSLFSGNSARTLGGAITFFDTEAHLTNCTFSGNDADDRGGALFVGGGGGIGPLPVVMPTNSIIWGNTDGDPAGTDESGQLHLDIGTISIAHSCVQGWTGLMGGVGNTGSDPLFVHASGADGIPGTTDDDLRLLPGSPVINIGDNTAVPAELETDLDGYPRINNGTVDFGAYEFCTVQQIYADVNSDWTVNFMDVSLILDVFRGTPTSIEFEDGDIAPCGGDGSVNFGDVSAAVDAFRGLPPCPNLCL